MGLIGRLGDSGIDDIAQEGDIGGLGGVALVINLGGQVLDGPALTAEDVQDIAGTDLGGVEGEVSSRVPIPNWTGENFRREMARLAFAWGKKTP